MNKRAHHASVLAVAVLVTGMLVAAQGAAQAAPTTYYVNNGATCSDGNPGTTSAPLCTITAAAKKAVSGDTVQVAAGTYPEQVTAVASGVKYVGDSQAKVVGSATVAAAAWSQVGTSSWGAKTGWPASPAQVSNGGTTLAVAASAAAVDTTPNSWFWDSSKAPATLLVNTGGNPGSTIKGSWAYGFLVRGLSGVTINGFSFSGQTGAGVSLDSTTGATVTSTTGSTVENTTVSGSGGYGISDSGGSNNTITGVHTTGNSSIGIRVLNATSDLVTASTSDNNGFHGVSIQGGSGNTVRKVTAFGNLKPGTRVAAGIDVSSSSSGALVEQNTVYGNDDSGIEIYTGSTNAVVRDNLSYDNHDHGIDISKAPNSTVVSNTVVGNSTSGINVEGGSTGTAVRDNIAVDNTTDLTRSKGDIRVDQYSIQGTTLDHDLVWESSTPNTPIFEWNGVTYTDFTAFRNASGQEAHGLDANPGFVSLAGRDLRLTGTSPAIDAADSTVAGWTALDHDGKAPVDDPNVANTGKGGAAADLGALEFIGAVAQPPTTSVGSKDGLTINVDASSSRTLGEQLTGRTVDCGNGKVVDALATGAVQCVYSKSGSYTVTVTVTGAVVNGHSWSDTASAPVSAQQDLPPHAVLKLSSATIATGGSVTADASGSSDDHPPIASYAFDCGNGTSPSPVSAATATCTYPTPGTYTVSVTVTDSAGQTATDQQTVTVAKAPTVALGLSSPSIQQGQSVTATATATTDAGDPVKAYRFSCGTGGTGAWQSSPTATCTYTRTGTYTVAVDVRDTLGVIGHASATVTVTKGVPPTARLSLSRSVIHKGRSTVAKAGASTGTTVSRINGYKFACGNRQHTAWTTSSRTTCHYKRAGRYTVKVWVRSTLGLVDTATKVVRVRR